ncbi:hypothetical protein Hanom_Chr01g00095111 [Helianthus anomalus]
MCTTNKQNLIDPGRVLPNWSQFSPVDSLNRILDKDYGITDKQKKCILDALRSDAKAVKVEDQEEWVDGEWEFFYDKCAELDLDPDFCVEDVYEDESGSAQFISQLAKTGCFCWVLVPCFFVSRLVLGWARKLLISGTFSLILFGKCMLKCCCRTVLYKLDICCLDDFWGCAGVMGLLSQFWHPGLMSIFCYLGPALSRLFVCSGCRNSVPGLQYGVWVITAARVFSTVWVFLSSYGGILAAVFCLGIAYQHQFWVWFKLLMFWNQDPCKWVCILGPNKLIGCKLSALVGSFPKVSKPIFVYLYLHRWASGWCCFKVQADGPDMDYWSGFNLAVIKCFLGSATHMVWRVTPTFCLLLVGQHRTGPLSKPKMDPDGFLPCIVDATSYWAQARFCPLASRPFWLQLCRRPTYPLILTLGLSRLGCFFNSLWKAHSMGLITCSLKAQCSWDRRVSFCSVILEKDIIPTRISYVSRYSMVFFF